MNLFQKIPSICLSTSKILQNPDVVGGRGNVYSQQSSSRLQLQDVDLSKANVILR